MPSYEILCASCGEPDTIPFEPKGEQIKCRDCFRAEREIRRRHAPIQKHNTRVMLPITCFKCGKKETLDHMPKGKRIEELMCTECTEETLGAASKWNEVRQQKRDERRRSWRVRCDDCGTAIYLNARPKRGAVVICESCDKDFVRAGDRDALRHAAALGDNVHKRVGRKPPRAARRVVSMEQDQRAEQAQRAPEPEQPPSVWDVKDPEVRQSGEEE